MKKEQSILSNLTVDDLLTVMESIVSTREFTDDSIEEEVMDKIFQAFIYGPSLANQQPWECLILNKSQQQKLVLATLDPFLSKGSYNGQSWIAKAPFVFIITLDRRRAEARLGEKGMQFSEQDVFTSIQNLRLIAHLEGLGTSVVREFNAKCLSYILNIPNLFLPIAIVALGYPKKNIQKPERFTAEDIFHRERIL